MVSAKLKHAVTLALVFFVVSSPYTYKMVDRVVGQLAGMVSPQLAYMLKVSEGGCATTYGLFLHSVVFGLVSYYIVSM